MDGTKSTRRKRRKHQTWFAFEERPSWPPANRTRCSIAAAAAIAEIAPTKAGQVFAFVARRRQLGATRYEIASALGLPLQTVCARVNDLIERYHLLHRTDETRENEYHNQVGVVRAVTGAAEELESLGYADADRREPGTAVA